MRKPLLLIAYVSVCSSQRALAAPDASDDSTSSVSSRSERPLSFAGIGAAVGGGVVSFTRGAARQLIDPGIGWTARLIVGTQTAIAFEVGYVGSVHDVDAEDIEDSAYVLAHGAEAALRVNLAKGKWQPFVSAGAAWKKYSLEHGTDITSSMRSSDGVFEVPLAVGMVFHHRMLMIDAVLDFRPAFDSEMMGTGDSEMTNWGASLRFGLQL
jgi:hypothetical protein